MASQTTTTQKREQTLIEPRDEQMRRRLGFDRRGLRREFAAVDDLSLSDKYIEQEDRTFIDPDTVDMPFGPSVAGETGGTGIRMYTEDGDQFQTYRFAHGFSVLQEDLEASNENLGQQRDEIAAIFDFFADKLAMDGLKDQQGNTIKKGILQYMKANIPAERTLNLEDFDGDAGDTDDYTSNPENVLFEHAFSNVSGNLMTDRSMRWDVMVCTQPAFAKFNQVQDSEQGVTRQTYWQRVNDEDAVGGVNDYIIVPKTMEYPYTPAGEDPITVDLSAHLGDNEAILLPDMEVAARKFWKLYEMDEPRAFPMQQKDGGRMRQDYAWRYNHVFNPKGHKRWTDLEDSVHLKNLSVLFT